MPASFEDFYSDLLLIASQKDGPLDELAVERATHLLALPRYDGNRGRLVADIKRVIGDLPEGQLPGSKGTSEHDFKAHTRLFFALDEPGTTLSARRKLGGGAVRWQTPAIIYRVLLALLELNTDRNDQRGYEIDHLLVTSKKAMSTSFTDRPRLRLMRPDIVRLDYTITMREEGPHFLWLPIPAARTKVAHVDAPNVQDPPMLLRRTPSTLWVGMGSSAPGLEQRGLLAFGEDAIDRDILRVIVEHKAIKRSFFRPRWIEFSVNEPIKRLTLELQASPLKKFQLDDFWAIQFDSSTKDAIAIANTEAYRWTFESPPIGATCAFGDPNDLTKADEQIDFLQI